MKKFSWTKEVLGRAAALALTVFASCSSALAQCAMCRTGVAGSTNAQTLSRALNLGGLVLLIPPIIIFTAFFVLTWRYARTRDFQLTEDYKESPLKRLFRFVLKNGR